MNEPTGTLRERMAREQAHAGQRDPASVRRNTLLRMSGWPAKDAPLPSDPCTDARCETCNPAPRNGALSEG